MTRRRRTPRSDPDMSAAEYLQGSPEPFQVIDHEDRPPKQQTNGEASAPTLPKLEPAAQFVANYVAPEYCIDGLLLRRRVYSLTGDTGHGKTAVALALAMHKALGQDLDGRKLEAGRVVYLAAENPDDIRMRIILIADRMKIDVATLPIYFAPEPFRLADSLGALASYVESIGGAELIIADTGAAFLAAGGADDENSNMHAYRFATDLRALTKLPGGPTSLALMHPVKRAGRENLLPRGGGAFLNEMDGNLVVWSEGDRKTTELSWQGKLRGATFDPIAFALETGTCEALIDAKGRRIPSVWASLADAQRVEQAVAAQTEDEDAALLAIASYQRKSFSDWAKLLDWRTASGAPAKYRVQRAVERLADQKLVRKVRGNRYALTATGKREVERVQSELKGAAE